MIRCLHCDQEIRWTELMGWVHGRNGDGYRVECINVQVYSEATPKPEDISWFTD